MLGMVKSCIGTKFTSQFGDLIAVSILWLSGLNLCVFNCFFLFSFIHSKTLKVLRFF